MARICTDLLNKMEEQVLEKLRAEALSHCRQLFEAESSSNFKMLSTKSILALIGSAELAEQIFALFDHIAAASDKAHRPAALRFA